MGPRERPRGVRGAAPSNYMTDTESHKRDATDFAQRATETRPGLLVELWEFLRHNKKWWLIPIILVLLLIGALILLAGTAAAPFIYPLF